MSQIVLPGNQLYLETKCNLYEASEFDETFRRLLLQYKWI